MNKSIFLLTLLFVGMLSISVTTKSELLGKWYVQSMEMAGSIEEFDSEDNAPWMEFQKDDVIILGEADRSPSASGWSYDAELNLVLIDAFGDEIGFIVKEHSESKLVLEAEGPDGSVARIVLKKEL